MQCPSPENLHPEYEGFGNRVLSIHYSVDSQLKAYKLYFEGPNSDT